MATLIGQYGGTQSSPIRMNVYSDGSQSPAGSGDYVAPGSTSSGTTVNAFDTPTRSTYGYDQNTSAEQRGRVQESFIENSAKSSGLIDSGFLTNLISSKPDVVAFYINALTYGGYTVGDILNDMKRRELIYKNDPKAKSMPAIIDPDLKRTEYQATAEGQRSVTEAASILPTFNLGGLMNPEILKYGSNMPDDVFKMLVPLLDKNSQEFKDAVANVKSAYYDLANQQLQASTEQEKAIADYNEAKFKEQINKQYGIILSDDATTAWKQLETLGDTFNTRGIAGSGMQNEAVDNYLRTVRKQDSRYRDEKLTKEEADKAAYYRTSASEAEIAALTPEERTKWGLTPSADIASKYSMANLRSQFPDSTEAELQAYRDAVLDSNGNYRSAIYSKYYTNLATNNTNKKSVAETQVLQDALNKEKQAYDQYDTTNALTIKGGTGSVPEGNGLTQTADTTGTTTDTTAGTNSPSVTAPVSTSTSGMSTDDVKKLQDYLVLQGYLSQTQVNTGYGTYGPQTTAAVKKLQDNLVKQGLMTQTQVSGGYGTYGPQTTAAVNALKNKPIVGPVAPIVTPKIDLGSTYTTPKTGGTTTTAYVAPKIPTTTPTTTTTTFGPVYNPTKTPTYTPPPVVKPTTYKVVSGDTLGAIAARNNTTVADLAKKNNITDPNRINVGQTLTF